jgi:xylan 1,4-beta-xylosidase
MKNIFIMSLLIIFLPKSTFTQPVPVSIDVDVRQESHPLRPIWTYFGYDEPNYTYMTDGQKLLSEISRLSPHPIYVRTHNLLTTREGNPTLKWGFTNVYNEDEAKKPIYDWTLMDSIIDQYIERGMKPLMEIGFMPKAMSSNPEPYQHSWNEKGPFWTGWTYPPKDYKKWGELVYQWVQHSIERYGQQEVSTWLWEVWNEPNIGYWSGTFEEYLKLYDFAIDAIKRACPECTVGGPHTTNPDDEKANAYLVGFLEHCLHGTNYVTGERGAPLEFVAFHAKGNPQLVDDHIQMNMATQLQAIEAGFKAVKSFAELQDIPVIIGECDPEGCAACSEDREPKYGYRNSTMYSSYMASSFAKIYQLMDAYQINLQGVLTWAFEFENQTWFAGFRDLASNGVDKPILNVFRMYGLMHGNWLKVNAASGSSARDVIEHGVRQQPDINALAVKDEKSITIMVWNYHDDNLPANDAEIKLTISGIEQNQLLLNHYRIDREFSNAFETWNEMGSPQNPTVQQYQELEKAGQLQLYTSPQWLTTVDNSLTMYFMLPRQAVSLLQLTSN